MVIQGAVTRAGRVCRWDVYVLYARINAVLCCVCNVVGVIGTLSYNIDVVNPSWSWFVMAVEFVIFPGTGIDEPLMQRWKVS